MSRWEADGAVPDTDRLIALSRHFGLALNELLQVEGPAVPAEKRKEETPIPAEPSGGRMPIRWKTVLLAALCFLAGLGAGLAPQIAERLTPPALSEQIDDWGVTAGEAFYGSDGREMIKLSAWARFREGDVLKGAEVFFQAETPDGALVASEEAKKRESLYGVTCTAVFVIPNQRAALSVGLRKNGQEQLQLLSEYGEAVP